MSTFDAVNPSLSRARERGVTELRGDCPLITVDVLDAVASHRRVSRTELVNQILGEWAQDRLHESQRIQRVVGSQSERSDATP